MERPKGYDKTQTPRDHTALKLVAVALISAVTAVAIERAITAVLPPPDYATRLERIELHQYDQDDRIGMQAQKLVKVERVELDIVNFLKKK
jgi:hypothetical protein